MMNPRKKTRVGIGIRDLRAELCGRHFSHGLLVCASSILYRSGQSLYLNRFGHLHRKEGLGIVFNDEMDDFNYATSPTSGASTRHLPTTSSLHILWLGDSIDSAVNRRRLHHQLLPPALQYEEGFEDAVVQGLTGLGHSVNKFAQGRSIIHGINVDDDGVSSSFGKKGGLSGINVHNERFTVPLSRYYIQTARVALGTRPNFSKTQCANIKITRVHGDLDNLFNVIGHAMNPATVSIHQTVYFEMFRSQAGGDICAPLL
ncbi:hypothetical protein Btru_065229 [Bulinus truncatus]|nr:hypothetical protein Btru_065229 [Bulinus truncatus]